MHGGQRERCASSAAARSGGSDPSMYSPRSSTQSAQCSRGLANVFRPAGGWKYEQATVTGPRGKDAPASAPIRSFSEVLAKFFAQGEPGAVQPAQAPRAAVRRKAIQHARDRPLPREVGQLLEGFEKTPLQHSLRVSLAARHAQREPVELALVPADQLGERRRIARLRLADEL